MLASPPFGVDWAKYAEAIQAEHDQLGFDGRFGPGLPRKPDGSMLFLLHMISKMKPAEKGGSRIAIIFNASPLFTGAAGGGESEISAGSSKTAGLKPSSPCPSRCSTTPESPPTSGLSPTTRQTNAEARSS